MGTLAEIVGIKVPQIFLTPIERAIPYIKSSSNVVIGTRDEAYMVYKKIVRSIISIFCI